MVKATTPTGSQSVERTFQLLGLITEMHRAGATLSEIIAQSNLTRPTVHRLLAALLRAGLIEQDDTTSRYHLGRNSYALGVIAQDRFGLESLAEASVHRLSMASGDTAFFSIRKGAASVCVRREEGRHPIRSHVLNVGQHHPLGVAAHGIAMLAALDDDEVNATIEENADWYANSYSNLTPDFLWQLVRETRDRGWSLNKGFFYENAWAIGTVVYDGQGQVAGALSIGAMKDRLDPDKQAEIAALLKREVNRMQSDHANRQIFNTGYPLQNAK